MCCKFFFLEVRAFNVIYVNTYILNIIIGELKGKRKIIIFENIRHLWTITIINSLIKISAKSINRMGVFCLSFHYKMIAGLILFLFILKINISSGKFFTFHKVQLNSHFLKKAYRNDSEAAPDIIERLILQVWNMPSCKWNRRYIVLYVVNMNILNILWFPNKKYFLQSRYG